MTRDNFVQNDYKAGCLISEGFSRSRLNSETRRTKIPNDLTNFENLTLIYFGIADHCEINRTYATQSGLRSYEANQSDIQPSERFRNFCPAGFRI